MDPLAAARLGDEVAHGFGLMAMVGGAVLGAVIGVAIVGATVATGGAALAIVAGSVAAGGLGLGQLVKGICTAASLPEPTTGKLVLGSTNIRINTRAAMRASVDMAGICSGIPLNHYPWPAPLIAEGSATVRFNGKPAARLSSKMVCGAHIKSGSGNVRIGGPTARTNFVWDVEQWTEWTLIGLGVAALGYAGRAAWVAGRWLGVGKFGGMLGLGFGGFELLGQVGDRLGPGYRDILQGAAGVVLLGLSPKLVKANNPTATNPPPISNNAHVRGIGSPARASRFNLLNDAEIEYVTAEWRALGGDSRVLKFNQPGMQTGFAPGSGKIYINGDVFPAKAGVHPTANLSVRETLAHEMGHMAHPDTNLGYGAWNDEFRASYWSSKNVPNLTLDERRNLAIDAWQRAIDAGQNVKMNSYLREMIYGY